MDKQAAKGTLLMFSIVALLTAINVVTNGRTENPEEYRTEYVGDSPNVVGIVSNLQYPEGYSYESIVIQSQNEPFGLTVFLDVDDDANSISTSDLQKAADSTFELIGNLGKLEYRTSTKNGTIASFVR